MPGARDPRHRESSPDAEQPRQGLGVRIPWLGIGILVLCGVTAWAYWGSLTAPFHFDDHLFLQSSRVTDPQAWRANLDPLQLRQVTYLTFHLNYRLGGTEPAGYHWVNLLVHLANVVLLWLVLRLLLARHPQAGPEAFRRLLPWAAAGVFALHPIQSEAVNYIYQRSTLLAAFFLLISAALLLQAARRRIRGVWLIIA